MVYQIFMDNWVSNLSRKELLNLQLLWNDSCHVDQSFIRQDNLERIFTIWAYLDYQKWKPNAPQRIGEHWQGIFERTIQDLMETSSTTQIALDLMTMASILRLFPYAKTISRRKTPKTFSTRLSGKIRRTIHLLCSIIFLSRWEMFWTKSH